MIKKIKDWIKNHIPTKLDIEIYLVKMVLGAGAIIVFAVLMHFLEKVGIVEPWYLIPPK